MRWKANGTPIEHAEGTFEGWSGLRLYRQCWRPAAGGPRAVLVNLHGLGDHSGLYPTLVEHFVPRGVAIHAFDLRGNGRSPGQRAYVARWAEFWGDLDAFVRLVTRLEPGVPLFLMGNSLGGLIVLDYILHDPAPLRGAVVVSPPLGRVGVPSHLMVLGRLLSRVWPRFSLEVGMDLTGLSRDPAAAETILADPLFHRRGTARLATEFTAAVARVHERAEHLALPLLILHGGEDRMVPPNGSRALAGRLTRPDVEYREYPGAYHALFVDADREAVLGDLERWLEKQLAG